MSAPLISELVGMKRIVTLLKNFRSEIESNTRLTIDRSRWQDFVRVSDSALGWMLTDLEEIDHIRMTREQAAIFELAGLKFDWLYNSGDIAAYGGVHVNGIEEALTGHSTFWKTDFSLANDMEVPEGLKHFERLNWFEKQAWADDWRYGCLIREPKSFPPRVALFDKNWHTEMEVGFEEYFEAMVASGATKGWQYFYIDWNQEIPHRELAIKDMKLAAKVLPVLFPEKDFAHHNEKLARVLSKT